MILTEKAILVFCLFEFVSLINIILREKNKRVESLYYTFNNRLSSNKDYKWYSNVEKCIKILHLYVLLPFYGILPISFTASCLYKRIIHKWYSDK